MILKDEPELQRFIPLKWGLLHPSMYEPALVAVAMKLAEVAIVERTRASFMSDRRFEIYWQRDIDNKQLELGL